MPPTVMLGYIAGPTAAQTGEPFEELLPLGICSLHSLLRSNGYQALLVNFSGMDAAAITSLLLQHRPDVVGLSLWTHNRHTTLELARQIRHRLPGTLLVVGGGHATHQAEQLLSEHPQIDLVACGEAEQTLLELLTALQNKKNLHDIAGLALRDATGTPRRTAARQPVEKLDLLPFPARFLDEAININSIRQAEFLSSSRGCPARCRFCASPGFWGRRVRFRSPESVAAEMRFLRDRYGLIYLSLRDDTFTADRRRTQALCRELISSRTLLFWNCQSRVEALDQETLDLMRQAGCECIQLGVESGSPRILELLGKRTNLQQIETAARLVHGAGLQLSVFLITGIPEENEHDMRLTRDLVRRIAPHDLQIAPLAYYPGTALFEAAVAAGTVNADIFSTNRSPAVLACPDGPRLVAALHRQTARYRHRDQPEELLALQQRQFSAVTAMQLGDLLSQNGQLQAAEAQYQTITQQVPDHPWGWNLLAELYEQTGRTAKARRCYQQLLQLVPAHQPAQQALQRLH